MKKYFLHIGTENSGPFDLEELKIKKITKKTPVWYDGLENWKYAEDLEELKSVFVIAPPPIETFKAQQAIPKIITEKKVEVKEIEEVQKIKDVKETKEVKILGLSKNSFFIGLTFIILLIATFIFNSYQENRDRLLEQRNHKTEIENHQYELQQKEIEEQKIALAEQQKREAERAVQENKQKINNRLIEIQNLLHLTNENLDNAKIKLQEVSGFKLLRTAAEKKEQMDNLNNEITSYLTQIESLKQEQNQLQLDLEKIK